jgi:hypothetical protein
MPTIDDALVLGARSDVRFRKVASEGIIVQQSSAEVIAVNEVGARVMQLMEKPKRLSEILETMSDEFDVDETRLREDVVSFLTELMDAGVIEEKTE